MYSRAYKSIVSLPPLAWVAAFLLLPYALMFVHSLWVVREGVIVHHWNLDNYKLLFTNPLYAEVLFRTMRIASGRREKITGPSASSSRQHNAPHVTMPPRISPRSRFV